MLAGVDVSYSRGDASSVVLGMEILMRGMLKFKQLKEWANRAGDPSRSGKVLFVQVVVTRWCVFWCLLGCALAVFC